MRVVLTLLLCVVCHITEALDPFHDDAFNHSSEIELGPNDGIVIVDMWDRYGCLAVNEQVSELGTRIDHFLNYARPRGVRIFHALSGSHRFDYDELLASHYWGKENPSRMAKKSRRWPKESLKILRSKQALLPSPLDIGEIFSRKMNIYCNDTRNTSSNRLNPNIHLNLTYDYMFDVGFFFDKMIQVGAKRLFYVGAFLNRCVLFARRFSAMEAAMTGRFNEIGIIVDLTASLIRRKRIPIALRNVSDAQQIDDFVSWMENTAKISRLSFWKTSSKETIDTSVTSIE
jgi:hypothetical protein